MSVTLCIDWGNSLVKAGIFNGEKLEEKYVFHGQNGGEQITALLDKHDPVAAIMCTVSNDSDSAESIIGDRVKKYIKLDNNTPLPIMNAYTSPGSLGADRLALAVGAYVKYPNKNNLVVSLGTCITYNFIQSTRTFRGGAISPGLHMRLNAMHHFTDRLPEVKLDGEVLMLGYDTETGIRGGAVCGMIAEIDGMVTDFSSQYPDFNAVLTGGDMSFFEGKLKSEIFADPDLLLTGLNLILKHNAPQVY
ncbi:MAG: type III pantothenate kinase [Flavipsychrobacter sp.]